MDIRKLLIGGTSTSPIRMLEYWDQQTGMGLFDETKKFYLRTFRLEDCEGLWDGRIIVKSPQEYLTPDDLKACTSCLDTLTTGEQ